ncbi:unnamed protein product [Candidula unifasciata]|uniref:Cytochrome c oxidase subunit 5A, mitochondrial n=1 Tax=Candidula unifasciata TaxID=100452 RepID=A0A8S3Z8T2_9EUPU|nr:unnamed protein product [Candidula unifasciata]
MFRISLKASTSLHNAARQCLKAQAGAICRPDIDHWEIRKAMNDITAEDLVPEPRIIFAAFKACRRLNDYSLAVRYLEAGQWKCGAKKSTIWPWVLQEIKPTLSELGILTPEEMGLVS